MDNINTKLNIINKFGKYITKIVEKKNNDAKIIDILFNMITHTYQQINENTDEYVNYTVEDIISSDDEDMVSCIEDENYDTEIEDIVSNEESDIKEESSTEDESHIEELSDIEEETISNEESDKDDELLTSDEDEELLTDGDESDTENEDSSVETPPPKYNNPVNDFIDSDIDISNILLYRKNSSYLERVTNYLQYITSY